MMRCKCLYRLCLIGWVLLAVIGAQAAAESVSVYIGTYTGGQTGSQGIYHSFLDPDTGKLTEPTVAAKADNPSFLTLSPNGTFLYAVCESDAAGGVAAYGICPKTGRLDFLNQQSFGGRGPCYVSTDHAGRHLFVAHYTSGSMAVLPIRPDGTLAAPTTCVQHQGHSINPQRQEGPHAHSVRPAPDDRFVLTADLGLDKVMICRLDPNGTLSDNDPPYVNLPPGSGPRHLAFGPDGKHAYVINELNSTIAVFDYDSEVGRLAEIQSISTVPDDFEGTNYCAEVCVHPNGRFLYGSNRGHDSIAVYRIAPETGKLAFVAYEEDGIETPRHFGIDPTGGFCLVANQHRGSVVAFRIRPDSGALEPTGYRISVPMPVCITFSR